MKLHPEDPRLTAYLLGELPADEAAAVERAVAADPALGLALRELENIQRLLTNTLAPGTSTLLPASARTSSAPPATPTNPGKSRLLSLAAQPAQTTAHSARRGRRDHPRRVHPHPASRRPGPQRLHSRQRLGSRPGALPLEVALLPAPGPADAGPAVRSDARPTASSNLTKAAAARSAALQQNGDLFLRKVAERLSTRSRSRRRRSPTAASTAALSPPLNNPRLPLPVHAGRSSLGWITRSIREDHKRPPANAVRLEEILNQFTLRPAGAAAVSQGVTLSTESICLPVETLRHLAARLVPRRQ